MKKKQFSLFGLLTLVATTLSKTDNIYDKSEKILSQITEQKYSIISKEKMINSITNTLFITNFSDITNPVTNEIFSGPSESILAVGQNERYLSTIPTDLIFVSTSDKKLHSYSLSSGTKVDSLDVSEFVESILIQISTDYIFVALSNKKIKKIVKSNFSQGFIEFGFSYGNLNKNVFLDRVNEKIMASFIKVTSPHQTEILLYDTTQNNNPTFLVIGGPVSSFDQIQIDSIRNFGGTSSDLISSYKEKVNLYNTSQGSVTKQFNSLQERNIIDISHNFGTEFFIILTDQKFEYYSVLEDEVVVAFDNQDRIEKINWLGGEDYFGVDISRRKLLKFKFYSNSLCEENCLSCEENFKRGKCLICAPGNFKLKDGVCTLVEVPEFFVENVNSKNVFGFSFEDRKNNFKKEFRNPLFLTTFFTFLLLIICCCLRQIGYIYKIFEKWSLKKRNKDDLDNISLNNKKIFDILPSTEKIEKEKPVDIKIVPQDAMNVQAEEIKIEKKSIEASSPMTNSALFKKMNMVSPDLKKGLFIPGISPHVASLQPKRRISENIVFNPFVPNINNAKPSGGLNYPGMEEISEKEKKGKGRMDYPGFEEL